MTSQKKQIVEMNRKRSGGKKVALSEILDDVFAESLKSPACGDILNCLRNVEKQMKKIFVLAKTTQE